MELFENFKNEALGQVEAFLANSSHNFGSPEGLSVAKEKVPSHFTISQEGDTQQVIDTRKIALEYSLRHKTLNTGAIYTNSGQQLEALFNCLELVLLCAEKELCDALLPLTLLEELLDTQTIEGCEKVFTFLERKIDSFTVGMVAGKGKGLVFLRLCNELLRRLSKTKNTVFCGRILILLAKVFPLGERSGVNLRGDFNIENSTSYEDNHMEDDTEGIQEDYKFYIRFWSLQQYFANPPLFFQQENHSIVKEEVENILNEFKKITSNDYTLMNANEKAQKQNGNKRTREEDSAFASNTNFFFPKFLSSRNLMALELEDPHFRRHILVQILIFLHYLMNFTASEKEKHATLKTPNKSVIQTFSLEPEQETWITQLWQDTVLLLQSTPPNGKRFTERVLCILDHERNWVNWKNESCPPFEKAALLASEASTEIAQKRVKLSIPPAAIKNPVGTRTLTKLWDLSKEDGDLLPALSNERTAPPLLEYLSQVGDIKAKINSSSEEEVEVAQSQRWRALRMASKQYLCCFGRIGNGDLSILKQEVLNEINKANEIPKPIDHAKHVEAPKPTDKKADVAKETPTPKQDMPPAPVESLENKPPTGNAPATGTVDSSSDNAPATGTVESSGDNAPATGIVDSSGDNAPAEASDPPADQTTDNPPKSPIKTNPPDDTEK
ncbi:hypothetical protein K493DRAFT_311502 [Basidiobolus meristosporus CBS 931.73]|uniref:THO complex subunit 1 n=1 Tax=Basidiobolus meristosporus CBS 931.73 TaxID=1314790 RepID=A0A1Y1Z2L4_9FUNG|nr:hypothetical protein K493DRAFT_311502 [Basidiobolus meristosporus CBS 931.73]|eukprot:ORY04075.1 hypothetical protein K493DRAFT_311502 [Basidiobolus meristosporus CBS 931.73]